MRRPRSLRERLALVGVLVTGGTLLILTVGFNLVLDRQLRSGADDLLHDRAAETLASLAVSRTGRLRLDDSPDDRSLGAGTWVYDGDRVLEQPPSSRDQRRQARLLVGRGIRTVQTGDARAIRYYALPVRFGSSQVGTVVTSVAMEPYQRAAELALLGSVALAVVSLGGAYLLTRALVGRALAPVAVMTQQAARWSSSDLPRRFGPGRGPTELAALAATLDALLDRLSAALRHEQQLSAELSHELRTPLSSVVAEVELLQSRPRSPTELAAGHAAVLAAAERMSRVLESLLTAARASAGTGSGGCDVLPAVQAAVAAVGPPPGVVSVHELVPKLRAGVDGALLERALAPVVDNAVRHCRTGVTITIGPGPGGPSVTVQDDGAGVPPGLTETAFEPGVRSEDGHGGAGLGLALARRLARAGGGELHLRSSECGARFVLALPA